MIILYKDENIKFYKRYKKDIIFVEKHYFGFYSSGFEYIHYIYHAENYGYNKLYMEDNLVKISYKFKNNGMYLYNDDIPSVIHYDKDGTINTEIYMKRKKIYRKNKPSIIEYKNGKLSQEKYIVYDIYRNDEPSCIIYDDNGNILKEYFGDSPGIPFLKVILWKI